MEEFIKGDIITFDGLTDHDGNIVFYASLEYSEAVLDTVAKTVICITMFRVKFRPNWWWAKNA